jgi:hypothetical protein
MHLLVKFEPELLISIGYFNAPVAQLDRASAF